MPSGVFPKVAGETIFAADYNLIQSTIDGIMGVGAGQSGYGQAVSSGQITTSPPTVVGVSQWTNLRNDMLKARQHQTGVSESANLTLPTTSSTIDATLANQYYNFSQTIVSNKFALGSGQSSSEGLNVGTRSTNWNGTITHTVTLSFANANQARYFFNAGGEIRFSASLTGHSSTSKTNTWATMLSSMGTIFFNYNTTGTVSGTASSAGTSYAIGWYGLTTSDQLCFYKPAPAGAYAANDYWIYARRDAGSTQIIFTINFQDDAGGNPNFDEPVDGTLTSSVGMIRPSGANVSVTGPTTPASTSL